MNIEDKISSPLKKKKPLNHNPFDEKLKRVIYISFPYYDFWIAN